MKKSLLPVLLLSAAFALSACNSATPQSVDDGSSVSTSSSVASEVEQTPAPTPADAPSQIEETVLFDENGIKITAKGINHESLTGPEIQLLIENNGSKDIIVQPNLCVVNGFTIQTSMSSTVTSGKSANDSVTIMESSLSDANIGKFEEISIDLKIADANTYSTDATTGLISLKTNYYGQNMQTYDDAGTVVYEADGIKIVSQGVEDQTMGKGVRFYVQNDRDYPVMISANDVSLNGFMVDESMSITAAQHSKAIGYMTFLNSSLEENSIEAISDIEMSFTIINADELTQYETTDKVNFTVE